MPPARAAGCSGSSAAMAPPDGLIEAGHAAGPRRRMLRIERGDGADGAQVQVERRLVGGVVQPPRTQWLDDLRVEAGRRDVVPGAGLVARDAALGLHRHRLAAVEDDDEAARAAVGEAEARDG